MNRRTFLKRGTMAAGLLLFPIVKGVNAIDFNAALQEDTPWNCWYTMIDDKLVVNTNAGSFYREYLPETKEIVKVWISRGDNRPT